MTETVLIDISVSVRNILPRIYQNTSITPHLELKKIKTLNSQILNNPESCFSLQIRQIQHHFNHKKRNI